MFYLSKKLFIITAIILWTGSCIFNMPGTEAKGNGGKWFKEDWGRIVITDAAGKYYTLYAVRGQVNLDFYELPPAPPEGMFDIRFGSGRIAEDLNNDFKTIEMKGITYPVKIKTENMDITLQDVTGKLISTKVKSGEEITISNPKIDEVMVSEQLIPETFALEQNFPNPFNPATTIKFSIPKEVHVNLSIFDILGAKVKELKNEIMKPGNYEVNLNASALASGVYLYRIKATSVGGQTGNPSTGSGQVFVQTKKMILLK